MIQIRGMAKTQAALREAEAVVRLAAPAAVEASAKPVAAQMQARAPRLTGFLASQISTDELGAKASIGSNAPYDRFVQFGTRYMSANPYGEAAANAAAPEVVAAQAAVYKAALDKLGG